MKSIKLTETDLHIIIKESVKKVLKEIYDKKAQMEHDWNEYEYNNMLDKRYFDDECEDKYSEDSNINIFDFHKYKDSYPF